MKSALGVALLLSALPASAERPSLDVSGQFTAALHEVRSGGNRLPRGAEQHVYLFFNGLMANQYPGYGEANVKRLNELGLKAQLVPIDSEASVLNGAKTVRRAMLAGYPGPGETRFVLIGHSKGAVDIAAALALYPELRKLVRLVIAIQAPYRGSPIAKDLEDTEWTRKAVQAGIPLFFGGDPNAVFDLHRERRREFIAKHPYPADTPALSLATSRRDSGSIMNFTAQYIWDKYGEKSDGMVVPEDAVLPGSRLIRVDDMDHAESILTGVPGFRHYTPGEVTEALVTIGLR